MSHTTGKEEKCIFLDHHRESDDPMLCISEASFYKVMTWILLGSSFLVIISIII